MQRSRRLAGEDSGNHHPVVTSGNGQKRVIGENVDEIEDPGPDGAPPTSKDSFVSWSYSLAAGFSRLFFRKKFGLHRILGLTYLVQLVAAVVLYNFDYERYLGSVLVWSLPLNAVAQSANAAFYFKFLPRKEDPGFSAVSDKSVLSYFTVLENSFYAGQLLFACVMLRPDLRELVQKLVVVEPALTFFPFYFRHLWPSSRIKTALRHSDRNMSDRNRLILTASAYAIKIFYLVAKFFIGLFPLYLVFMDRVTPQIRMLLYGVQLLSSYASTVSIFLHTLRFKGAF